MSHEHDPARRLIRALSNQPAPEDHAVCQAALSEFIEAEIAGDDTGRLFPEVQSHLDICEECDALHTAMLDVFLADEANQIPEPERAPTLRLPAAVRLRHWATETAGRALDALRQSREDLEGAVQAFFKALAQSSGRLELRTSPQAFGLGESESEALPLVMAAYYTVVNVSRQLRRAGLELAPLVERGGAQPIFERAAREEAARVGLKGPAAQQFVQAFVAQALGDLPQFTALLDTVPLPSD